MEKGEGTKEEKRREKKRREKYRSEEAVKKNARIIAVELRIRKKRREKKWGVEKEDRKSDDKNEYKYGDQNKDEQNKIKIIVDVKMKLKIKIKLKSYLIVKQNKINKSCKKARSTVFSVFR